MSLQSCTSLVGGRPIELYCVQGETMEDQQYSLLVSACCVQICVGTALILTQLKEINLGSMAIMVLCCTETVDSMSWWWSGLAC